LIDIKEYILILGGFYNIGFALFHAKFWTVFNWKNDLPKLTRVNYAIMRILNYCLIFIFLLMAYISFFHQFELLYTGLGNTLLFAFAIFWILRLLMQFKFFGIKNKISNLFVILFLFGGLIYSFVLYY
jgi:hypothetical protein